MRSMGSFFLSVFWVTGWVLAKGFWSTFFAVVFPPYSWYIVVEFTLKFYKIIQ
jgi:hypothetical protein